MKILHTADWHLGKRLDIYSRLQEQKLVLGEICDIAERENVDVVLIAGDLFDTFNPSAEAEDLLYCSLVKLSGNGSRAVVAIAGNHDAPDRIDAPNAMARANGVFLIGSPDHKMRLFTNEKGIQILRTDAGFLELKLPSSPYPLRLIITPYANELRMKTYLGDGEGSLNDLLTQKWKNLAEEYCDEKGVNFLMAHLFFMKKGTELEKEDEGERSILHIGGAQPVFSENIPAQIQYVALGHLHRYHAIDKVPCPVVYSSSPLCYSFAEAGQTKKVVIIQAEPGNPVSVRDIELKSGMPLLRKEFKNAADAVAWLQLNPKAYVELTIETESYLDGQTRKILAEAHDYIVDVIPKKIGEESEEDKDEYVDPKQDVEVLFKEYFRFKNGGLEPSASIMSMFKEVISQSKEEEA